MSKHALLLPAHEKLLASLAIMRAIAHSLRLDVLSIIDKQKELSVGDIYKALKIEQALAHPNN